MKTHKDGNRPVHNEIFVFGSNLSGIHGAGAARAAAQWYGAKNGTGIGLTGDAYAIPTKDQRIQTMSLDVIVHYIRGFNDFAKARPDLQFFLTRIGCGLAGYTDKDIAPLFEIALDNVDYPEQWAPFLKDKE